MFLSENISLEKSLGCSILCFNKLYRIFPGNISHRFPEDKGFFSFLEEERVGGSLGWILPKGVGPSTTLAWPGWKQPEIAVTGDRHDSKRAGSKNVV